MSRIAIFRNFQAGEGLYVCLELQFLRIFKAGEGLYLCLELIFSGIPRQMKDCSYLKNCNFCEFQAGEGCYLCLELLFL